MEQLTVEQYAGQGERVLTLTIGKDSALVGPGTVLKLDQKDGAFGASMWKV